MKDKQGALDNVLAAVRETLAFYGYSVDDVREELVRELGESHEFRHKEVSMHEALGMTASEYKSFLADCQKTYDKYVQQKDEMLPSEAVEYFYMIPKLQLAYMAQTAFEDIRDKIQAMRSLVEKRTSQSKSLPLLKTVLYVQWVLIALGILYQIFNM